MIFHSDLAFNILSLVYLVRFSLSEWVSECLSFMCYLIIDDVPGTNRQNQKRPTSNKHLSRLWTEKNFSLSRWVIFFPFGPFYFSSLSFSLWPVKNLFHWAQCLSVGRCSIILFPFPGSILLPMPNSRLGQINKSLFLNWYNWIKQQSTKISNDKLNLIPNILFYMKWTNFKIWIFKFTLITACV